VVDAIKMWCVYASASVREQMQYRMSFLTGAIGQFLVTGIEFLAVWALFHRFGSLGQWTLPEVALFYSVANIAFAIADMLCTGFDQAGQLVRNGELDRLLLRPRTTVLQLFGYQITLRRLGRLAQALTVFGWSLAYITIDWDPAKIALLLACIACAASLFLSLFALQATMAIFTVQTLELVNATTYGGVYAAQYPLDIYAKWFRWLLTFILPFACVIYFPMITILGKGDVVGIPHWIGYVTPIAGPLLLVASLGVWGWGVRRYASTGS